jgi:hypothetical protein
MRREEGASIKSQCCSSHLKAAGMISFLAEDLVEKVQFVGFVFKFLVFILFHPDRSSMTFCTSFGRRPLKCCTAGRIVPKESTEWNSDLCGIAHVCLKATVVPESPRRALMETETQLCG